MPSPDVVAYVDLELSELTAQQLLDTALANLSLSFPDWQPREGNTEVVLLEEFAAMVEDDVYALNRLPGALTEVLLRLFGLARDQGNPPTATVEFTTVDASGYTVPAGTTVRLDLGAGVDPVDFVTITDLVIAPGSTTGTTTADASEPVTTANGRAQHTPLEVLDALTFLESAELAAPIAGGRLAETGDAFLDRAVPALQRLNTTLVLPSDVEAFVATNPEVTRVRTVDLYDPNGPGAPGTVPGFVTVAVTTAGGGALTATDKAFIAETIRGKMHAGLVVNVVDANVTVVPVTLTVLRKATAVDADVEVAVTQLLTDYLDPDTWPWGDVVRVNELIAVADRAEGVDVVLTIDPASDVELPGVAPLAKIGSVTVTVQAP